MAFHSLKSGFFWSALTTRIQAIDVAMLIDHIYSLYIVEFQVYSRPVPVHFGLHLLAPR